MESCKLRYFNSFEFFDHGPSGPGASEFVSADLPTRRIFDVTERL